MGESAVGMTEVSPDLQLPQGGGVRLGEAQVRSPALGGAHGQGQRLQAAVVSGRRLRNQVGDVTGVSEQDGEVAELRHALDAQHLLPHGLRQLQLLQSEG